MTSSFFEFLFSIWRSSFFAPWTSPGDLRMVPRSSQASRDAFLESRQTAMKSARYAPLIPHI